MVKLEAKCAYNGNMCQTSIVTNGKMAKFA